MNELAAGHHESTGSLRRRRRGWRAIALAASMTIVAAACSGDGDDQADGADDGSDSGSGGGSAEPIEFWSTETEPGRLAATEELIEAFTTETGIDVELVPVEEDDLPQLMTVNAASGTLPDVVFHPVDFTAGWVGQGLLDPEAAAEVVDRLDPSTFSAGALELVTVDGTIAAVPSDGWGQLLIYRQDLFDAAGLERPDTYAAIAAAAEALHDPDNSFYGITASTDPAAVFTQQTFEQFALANGCGLVDEAGEVTLDSPECVEAVEFYTSLIADYSLDGIQDVESTRATYFAGQASMVVWSPFILDEMAGLRDDAQPTCPECGDDPAYLAENSGVVSAIAGPQGAPAQYGQVSLLGIGADAEVESAQAFIEYWMSDGYLDWLAVGPEGKFPMRQGTAEDPTANIDGWRTLESGVDQRAVLGEIYGAELIEGLIAGTSSFDRWGLKEGQGELVAAVYSSLPVPIGLGSVLDGSADPAGSVAEMAELVREEQELLG